MYVLYTHTHIYIYICVCVYMYIQGVPSQSRIRSIINALIVKKNRTKKFYNGDSL